MSTGDGDNPVSEEPRRPLARARRVVEEPIRATRAVPETPPEKDTSTPGVVICFRVFCSILAFVAAIGTGCSFVTLSNNFFYDNGDGPVHFAGFLALALAVFTLFTIPVLFPRSKPWMWWYGLAIILLSTLSMYLTIFGILLLIFWVQPRTQQYFGRRMEVKMIEPRRRRYFDDDDFEDEDELAPRRPARRGPRSVQLD